MSDFSFCEKRRNYNIQYEKKGGSIIFNIVQKEESIKLWDQWYINEFELTLSYIPGFVLQNSNLESKFRNRWYFGKYQLCKN